MFTMLRKKHGPRRLRRESKSRQLRVERLEDRRLLAFADFELSRCCPPTAATARTASSSAGSRITGNSDIPTPSSQPLGDVNQDGIDDFYLAAPGTNGGTAAGQAYVIFGRAGGGFPAELDLTTLDGTNGYVIDGVSPRRLVQAFSGAGQAT